MRFFSVSVVLLVFGVFMTDEISAQVLSEKDLGFFRGDNQGDRVFKASFATRSAVLARNGMAATSHPLASQIAIDVLKAGGTAVDAAIAANAALGLMEPTGNGIGGDLFAIVWDPATKRLYGLNASGRSPMGQDLATLKSRIPDPDDIPEFGSAAVTVPGAVDGWFELHGRFGKLDMPEILAPTITYAKQGFPVTEVIAEYMAAYADRYERLHKSGEIEEIANYKAVFQPNGRVPVEGDLFQNTALASTLEKIAAGGRDVFYKGEIARTIDAYFKQIGGALRYEDFANHTSDWLEPVSVNYRGLDVWELPPQWSRHSSPSDASDSRRV